MGRDCSDAEGGHSFDAQKEIFMRKGTHSCRRKDKRIRRKGILMRNGTPFGCEGELDLGTSKKYIYIIKTRETCKKGVPLDVVMVCE